MPPEDKRISLVQFANHKIQRSWRCFPEHRVNLEIGLSFHLVWSDEMWVNRYISCVQYQIHSFLSKYKPMNLGLWRQIYLDNGHHWLPPREYLNPYLIL